MHPMNGLGIANRFAGAAIRAVLANGERSVTFILNSRNRTRTDTVANLHAFYLIDLVHLASSATQGICLLTDSLIFRLAKCSPAGCEQNHSQW